MLAERWQCSERHIRNQIAAGRLRAFRVGGKLLRISMDAVEEYECQSIACASTEGSSPSHGLMKSSADNAARLARLTVRRPTAS
ncbi:helix-turn-helix domain-containing protein [Bosea sp. SSUT16]|uniref:Helix-turn-helix domain-containing protein n=1 Tax=Bosea spartocytisi TaxID=2773451 RepID=A0A927E4X0_9HYPH|nr:helix-turn-helix domain-containing protein [Bosea spartocytisi]